MVKHCAATLRYWTRHVVEGADVDFSRPGTEEQEWEIAPDDTPVTVGAFLEQEHAGHLDVSRELTDGRTGVE